MTVSLIFILASCLGCMAAMPGTAEGTELSFSGAIAESTCRDIAIDAARSRAASPAHPLTCVAPGGIIASSTSYSLSKVSLTGSEHDQLLSYFVHYIRESQPAATSPVLLTRAYL